MLTDAQLSASGVGGKEERKLVLAALRKAGYKGASAKSPAKRATAQASSSVRKLGSRALNDKLRGLSVFYRRRSLRGRNASAIAT